MTFCKPRANVARVPLDHGFSRRERPARVDEAPMEVREQIRIVVCLTPDHHTVEMREFLGDDFHGARDGIELERQLRNLAPEPACHVVSQWGNPAILFRAQPLQPRAPRVDYEDATTRWSDRL